jgi:hypothetical protein
VASLSKRTTEAGARRYDVRYRTPSGNVRTRTFRTRRDAERFASTVEADKLRGEWVDPHAASRTLADVSSEWIQSNPAKRPSTRATDTSHLDTHVLPALGSRAVGRISRRDVQAAINQWSSMLSPRTVRRVFGTLNAILNYANECELVARNPCRGVKLPSARRVERPLPTAEQLADLAGELGDDFGIMVYLGAVLGLRWGECAGLRVGRIDFIRTTLTVAEQITRGSHGEPRTGPPKSSAGNRTLSMPSSLAEVHDDAVTKRRLGGWLLLAALLLVCVGGVVWHRGHSTVQPPPPPPGIYAQAGADAAPIGTMITSVGSGDVGVVGPDHAPAIWLFVIGGAVGVVGAFLLSRAMPTPDRADDRPDSD